MSTITQVRFWNDCGFTENCLEVPSKSDTLPTPSLVVYDDLNVSVDRMFSQFKLRQSYSSLMNVSYLEATYEMNNGSDLTIYGWVDSVSVQSDTSAFPMTVVDWHIDYWRTYLNQATFGSGMVRRRFHDLNGSDDSIPPQSYPHRFVTYTDRQNLTPSSVWWVMFFYTSQFQVDSSTYSSLYWGAYPVDVDSVNTGYYVTGLDSQGQSVTKQAPSLAQTAGGWFDEYLGIDPESLYYVAISPIPPRPIVSGTGDMSSPFNLGWGYDTNSRDKTYGWFASSSAGQWAGQVITITSSTTTDTDVYAVTGFNGEIIGALPWGVTATTCRARLVPVSSALTLELRFDSSPYASQVEGMTFDIVCPSMDIGSNAWSSYVYSGARDADMRQRQLQAESSAVSGGISSGTSAISGAVTGAMLGSAAGPMGIAGGAILGAISSAGTSLISTGANYAYQTGSYADEMQAIADYRASNQTSSVLIAGSGLDIVNNGIDGVGLAHYTYDEYAMTQRENDIILYGANVSEPMESCQSLVDAGGPLQISNLTVGGSIPVEAKQFFRTRFSKGVRMLPGPEQTVTTLSEEIADEQ